MTQLEILGLAYEAAAQKWAESKEDVDKAIAEGRKSPIAMAREARYREKLEILGKMIDEINAEA